MRLARLDTGRGIYLARLHGDTAVLLHRESEHPAADAIREALSACVDLRGSDGPTVPLNEATVLAPVIRPSKFLAIGVNYRNHATEAAMDLPDEPLVFGKYPNTIVGPGVPIVIDRALTSQPDYEVELGVVIGRPCSKVSREDAIDYVLGYTVVNDISARDLQFADGQWTRGKSLDTFGPVGPYVVGTDELGDGHGLRLTTTINDDVLQNGTTDDMIFDVAAIVSHLSQGMTLEPGDLIATGTPDGVGLGRDPNRWLVEGDIVIASVQGIGELSNPVHESALPSKH